MQEKLTEKDLVDYYKNHDTRTLYALGVKDGIRLAARAMNNTQQLLQQLDAIDIAEDREEERKPRHKRIYIQR